MMMKLEICASCSENLRSRIGNDEKGDCVLRNIGSVCGSEALHRERARRNLTTVKKRKASDVRPIHNHQFRFVASRTPDS
jgi:hypothetical protein